MYHYSDKKYPCLVGIGLIKGLLEITLYLKWPLKEPRSQFPLHPPWCLSSSLALLPWCVLPRRLPQSESPPSYLASYREHNKRQWFFISFCIKVAILATAKGGFFSVSATRFLDLQISKKKYSKKLSWTWNSKFPPKTVLCYGREFWILSSR